ncbi:MAG: FAD binding domain-containing protein [Alkalilacustris sp.]
MKASAAGYVRARDVAHALELLAAAGEAGKLLAGGQSLVAAMNLQLNAELKLIDINSVAALRGIQVRDGVLRLGALTRHADLASDPLVARHAPLLAQAAPLIAHAAIRNRGTLGGSLAHADPAAELPACVLALGAVMVVEGPGGVRRITAHDFFAGVFETALGEDELLVAVEVPLSEPGERHVIRELARRSGDYAIVGLTAVRRAAGHRLAWFGVGETPVLSRGAMAALDRGDVEAAVAALGQDLDPQDDLQGSAAYRRHVAGVLLRRTAAELEEAAHA